MLITSRSTYFAVLSQVALLAVLAGAVFLIIGMLVWQRMNSWLVLVALGLIGLIGLAVLRALLINVINVKHGHAVIVEDINTHEWIALLKGFHFCPPALYRVLGEATNFATEYTRTIHNVTMQDGPALSLRITYTAQIAVPSGVLRLPRKNMAAEDLKTIIGLYIRSLDGVWDQKHGVALEEALRHFFGGHAQAQVYKQGDVQILPERLNKEINQYLVHTVKQDKGYVLRVCTLEVLGMSKQGTLIRHNQIWARFIKNLAPVPPKQALRATKLVGQLSGGAAHRHVHPNGHP